MKAAILVELKKPLVLAELKAPAQLTFGQVRVKVLYSGICGAQLNEIEGAKGPDKFLPHLLGHEGSARVLEVGPGVKHVKAGDTVVMHWRPSLGLQCDPPAYDWNGKKVNAGWVTTFNDEAIVSENRVTKVPADLDVRLAPLFGCAVTTATGVINRDANVQIGQSVVVIGAGGVGINLVQAAQMVSANPIIAIDIVESKLAWATKFGATHTLVSAPQDTLAQRIRDIVGPQGADVVIDTTGNGRVIELAYDVTHADGKTILVGVPKKGDNINIYSLPLHFKKVLKGSHGGGAEPHIDIPRLCGLLKAGRMTLDGLVTHEFPLAEINEAIAVVKRGEAGRVLVRMD
jgi:S-(hydroxymethyl)glutathione dehydrogenase/alcohol dehydrogenase